MVAVRILLAALAFATLTGAALAESQHDRQEKACQGDAYKFCKDAIPDEDAIAACMGKHRAQLSVNCGILFDTGGK